MSLVVILNRQQIIELCNEFIKTIEKHDVSDWFSYYNAGNTLAKYAKEAGSKRTEYFPEWGGWLYLDWGRATSPQNFFTITKTKLKDFIYVISDESYWALTKAHLDYLTRKKSEWESLVIEFGKLIEKYLVERGKHLKAVHDGLDANDEYWAKWSIRNTMSTESWEAFQKDNEAKKRDFVERRTQTEKSYSEIWKILIEKSDDFEFDPVNFETFVLETTLTLPEISKQRKLYKPYELPAKTENSENPKCLVEITAHVKSGNKTYPVPEGTKIKLSYEYAPSYTVQIPGVGNFLTTSMEQLQNNQAIFFTGKSQVYFCASSGAVGWRIDTESSIDGKYMVEDPHTYTITAIDKDRTVLAKSQTLTIVEDKPKKIYFIPKTLKTKWDKSFDKELGDTITGLKNSVGQNVKLGSIWESNIIPADKAIYFVAWVTDDYRNPIEMNLDKSDRKGNYALTAIAKPGTDVVFGSGTDGYFFSTQHGIGKTDAVSQFRFYANPKYPRGVLTGYWIPSIGWNLNPDKITFQVSDLDTHQTVFENTITINTSNVDNVEKLAKWFFTGEAEEESFLLEMGISIIPIIGDSRDLFVYGWKQFTNQKLSTFDHIVASLSMIGLTLDIATVVTLGVAGTIDMIVKGLKGIFKFVVKATKGVAMKFFEILLQIVRRMYNLVRDVIHGNPSTVQKATKELDEVAQQVGTFVNKTKEAMDGLDLTQKTSLDKIKDWFNVLSMIIVTPAMLIDICTMLKNYTFAQVIEILYFIAFVDDDTGGQLNYD